MEEAAVKKKKKRVNHDSILPSTKESENFKKEFVL